MEYVLFVFIMVGEHINLKTTDFTSEQTCNVAAEWVNKTAAKSHWNENYKPKAECFEI